MEGEDREDSLGVDFSLLLPGARRKQWTFACGRGFLWALGSRCPLWLQVAWSISCPLRLLQPVPGRWPGSTAGEEGTSQGSLMVCSSHSKALLASSQVRWTTWKNMSHYYFSVWKGKKKNPRTQSFGKLEVPELLKPQQGRCPHLPWELLLSWALAFGPHLSCVTSGPCLAMGPTELG